MKLKKIVSLALAGILAVSMLTACGDKGSSSSNTNNGDVTVTSSVLDTIEAAVKKANTNKVDFSYKALTELEGKLSTELAKDAPEEWDTTIQTIITGYYKDAKANSANFAEHDTDIKALTTGQTKYYYQAYELDSKVTGTTSLVMKAYEIAADLAKLPAATDPGALDLTYTVSAVECTGKKADGTSFSKVIVLVKVEAE